MNERVVEILIYIMSEIRRDRDVSKKLDVLSQDLIKQGYTESEISSAFTWLLDKLNNESEELVHEPGAAMAGSLRYLHEAERNVLTTDAYGFLIQLKELGIINNAELEGIIERAMMLSATDVTVSEIKTIAVSVLFNSDDAGERGFFSLDDNSIIQ